MNGPTYKALSLEHYAAIQPSDSRELHKALYNIAVLPAMHEITICNWSYTISSRIRLFIRLICNRLQTFMLLIAS